MNYLRVIENWAGWKIFYFIIVVFWIFLIGMSICDTIYVFVNNGYPPKDFSIGAEGYGWSYKSVKNYTIYGLFFFVVNIVFFIIPFKLCNKAIYRFLISFLCLIMILKLNYYLVLS